MKWFLCLLAALTVVCGSVLGFLHWWGITSAVFLSIGWCAVVFLITWAFIEPGLKDPLERPKVFCLFPLIFLIGIVGGNAILSSKPKPSESGVAATKSQKEKGKKEESASAVEMLTDGVKRLENDLDEFRDDTDNRLKALERDTRADRALLHTVVVPPPPTEAPETFSAPTEEDFEPVPQKTRPKGFPLPTEENAIPEKMPIPNTTPKESPPDLWVSRKLDAPAAKQWPTHVLGSCGRAHAIIDWTADNRPVYGPCRDIAGDPACKFVKFGHMTWEK